VCVCVCVCVCERERESDRRTYIYTYIYIEREREKRNIFTATEQQPEKKSGPDAGAGVDETAVFLFVLGHVRLLCVACWGGCFYLGTEATRNIA